MPKQREDNTMYMLSLVDGIIRSPIAILDSKELKVDDIYISGIKIADCYYDENLRTIVVKPRKKPAKLYLNACGVECVEISLPDDLIVCKYEQGDKDESE